MGEVRGLVALRLWRCYRINCSLLDICGERGGPLSGGEGIVGQPAGYIGGAAGVQGMPRCVLEPTSLSPEQSGRWIVLL